MPEVSHEKAEQLEELRRELAEAQRKLSSYEEVEARLANEPPELRMIHRVDPDWVEGDPLWHLEKITSPVIDGKGGNVVQYSLVSPQALNEVNRIRQMRAAKGQRVPLPVGA